MEKEKRGEFVTDHDYDVLTVALENPEHLGCTRAAGAHAFMVDVFGPRATIDPAQLAELKELRVLFLKKIMSIYSIISIYSFEIYSIIYSSTGLSGAHDDPISALV